MLMNHGAADLILQRPPPLPLGMERTRVFSSLPLPVSLSLSLSPLAELEIHFASEVKWTVRRRWALLLGFALIAVQNGWLGFNITR